MRDDIISGTQAAISLLGAGEVWEAAPSVGEPGAGVPGTWATIVAHRGERSQTTEYDQRTLSWMRMERIALTVVGAELELSSYVRANGTTVYDVDALLASAGGIHRVSIRRSLGMLQGHDRGGGP
jgi:hypothetical protein